VLIDLRAVHDAELDDGVEQVEVAIVIDGDDESLGSELIAFSVRTMTLIVLYLKLSCYFQQQRQRQFHCMCCTW
jgi:hypothetical protein